MKPKRSRRVWSATGALAGVVAVLYATVVRDLPAPRHHVAPYLLALLFGLAEVAVVHVESRSQTHTYSLVEVPLILGLLAAPPSVLPVAQVIGAAFALGVYRRQPLIKLAFNLTTFVFETEIALMIFHGLANQANLASGATIGAVFAAALAASLLGILAVFAVVAIADGTQTRTERAWRLAFGLTATAVTTSTMLVGVVLHQTNPSTVWLLVLPIAGVYLAERAFVSQIREHKRLQFLHDSTALAPGLGGGETLTLLLHQMCQNFQADVAALTYLPAGISEAIALAVVGPEGRESRTTLGARSAVWDEWTCLAPGRDARVVADHAEARRLGSLLGGVALREALVVPLHGEVGLIGYLTVGNRLSDIGQFGPDDLKVVETLERVVSMGLESGHLEQSLQEARMLERRLVHRATKDPLTGLATQVVLADNITRRLERGGGSEVALLVIDLGEPDAAHDEATVDQLLVVTAQRLGRCIRDGDLPAALGRNQLAVVAQVADDNGHEACRLGARLVESLACMASIGGGTIETVVSVAIVLGRNGDDVSVLVAACDDAARWARFARRGSVEIVERGPEQQRWSSAV